MFNYVYPHSVGRSFRGALGSKTPSADLLDRESFRISRFAAQFLRRAGIEPDFLSLSSGWPSLP